MPSVHRLRPELLALLSALLLASPVALADTPAPGATAGASLPAARTSELSFSIDEGALLIKDSAASKTFRLHPIAAAVYVLSDGNYLIKAVATDQAGRVGEQGVTVTVSHAAPVPDTEGPQLAGITVDGTILVDGATFNGSSKSVVAVQTTGPAVGGESPSAPATLTYTRADGVSRVYAGKWSCGA